MNTKPEPEVFASRVARITNFLNDLYQGEKLLDASAKHGFAIHYARQLAAHVGWSPSWRNRGDAGDLSRSRIVAMFMKEGRPMSVIARVARLSRQRIEQVLQEEGVDTRAVSAEMLALRRAERAKEADDAKAAKRERRQKERELRYADARRLWDEGVTVQEIATMLGVHKATLATDIWRLRAELGWFPRRK